MIFVFIFRRNKVLYSCRNSYIMFPRLRRCPIYTGRCVYYPILPCHCSLGTALHKPASSHFPYLLFILFYEVVTLFRMNYYCFFLTNTDHLPVLILPTTFDVINLQCLPVRECESKCFFNYLPIVKVSPILYTESL